MRVARDYYAAAQRAGEAEVEGIETVPSPDGPILAARYAVKDGRAAARLLLELADEDCGDPWVRGVALRLRQAYRGEEAFARAVQRYVKATVAFVREKRETFQSTRYTLRTGAGDCDDHARVVYVLLTIGGARARIRFLLRADGQPKHAVTTVELGGVERWLETTVDAAFGEDPRLAVRRLKAERGDIMADGMAEGDDTGAIKEGDGFGIEGVSSTADAIEVDAPGVVGFRILVRNVFALPYAIQVRNFFGDQESAWFGPNGDMDPLNKANPNVEVLDAIPAWAPTDQQDRTSGAVQALVVFARARWGAQGAGSMPRASKDGGLQILGAWALPKDGTVPKVPSPLATSMPTDPKQRRYWNKAYAVATAWREKWGKVPSRNAVALAMAVAENETSMGDAGGTWAGEHNWGATTERSLRPDEAGAILAAGGNLGGPNITISDEDVVTARAALKVAGKRYLGLHRDSHGVGGVPTSYLVYFFASDNDVDPAKYFLGGLMKGNVTSDFLDGATPAQLAQEMRKNSYYWGVPLTAPEPTRVANYAAGINRSYPAILASLDAWDPANPLHDKSAERGGGVAGGGGAGGVVAALATAVVVAGGAWVWMRWFA